MEPARSPSWRTLPLFLLPTVSYLGWDQYLWLLEWPREGAVPAIRLAIAGLAYLGAFGLFRVDRTTAWWWAVPGSTIAMLWAADALLGNNLLARAWPWLDNVAGFSAIVVFLRFFALRRNGSIPPVSRAMA